MAKLWNKATSIEGLNESRKNTIHTPLGIEFTEIGDDYLEASMPVDSRTWQPRKILHGGASAVLAESLGSIASYLIIPEDKTCFGIELNLSHLNSISEGRVIGRVKPIRIGKTLHVWDILIRDGNSKEFRPICQSRLTVLIRNLK